MIDTTKFIQTTWQITWHKLSNNTQRLLSHYCFSFLFVSFPFFFFFFFVFLFFFFLCRWCFFGSTLTFLRKYLWKSGAVDFAWDTDFAHLLCVVRHSYVRILKPQSVWSDLFIFQSFTEIKFHSSEGLSWHFSRL